MDQLRIVIPNHGKIKKRTIELLEKAGFNLGIIGDDTTLIRKENIIILFTDINDIPNIIKNDGAEIGFTEEYILQEKDINYRSLDEFLNDKQEIKKDEIDLLNISPKGTETSSPFKEIKRRLNFCDCRIVIKVPVGSKIASLDDVPNDARVATNFPNFVKKFFLNKFKTVVIVEAKSTIDLLEINAVDFVIDLSSRTADLSFENPTLKEIVTIFESSAIIITSVNTYKNKMESISSFLDLITSTEKGLSSRLLKAIIPKNTITLLAPLFVKIIDQREIYDDPDHLSIDAIVKASDINQTIKIIKDNGGTDIIILGVEKYY